MRMGGTTIISANIKEIGDDIYSYALLDTGIPGVKCKLTNIIDDSVVTRIFSGEDLNPNTLIILINNNVINLAVKQLNESVDEIVVDYENHNKLIKYRFFAHKENNVKS